MMTMSNRSEKAENEGNPSLIAPTYVKYPSSAERNNVGSDGGGNLASHHNAKD